MNPLDLLFPYDPGDANYSYTTATIEVTNTSGNGRDIENIALTKNGTTFSGTFPRTVIDDAASPTIGDGTLQHYSNDNIVAVFRTMRARNCRLIPYGYRYRLTSEERSRLFKRITLTTTQKAMLTVSMLKQPPI